MRNFKILLSSEPGNIPASLLLSRLARLKDVHHIDFSRAVRNYEEEGVVSYKHTCPLGGWIGFLANYKNQTVNFIIGRLDLSITLKILDWVFKNMPVVVQTEIRRLIDEDLELNCALLPQLALWYHFGNEDSETPEFIKSVLRSKSPSIVDQALIAATFLPLDSIRLELENIVKRPLTPSLAKLAEMTLADLQSLPSLSSQFIE